MRMQTKAALGSAVGLFALWVGWGVYVSRKTERVPYERLDTVDGVEFRRYPRTILVETTAPDRRTAFRRLFRYISGANEGGEAVAMTAPVATGGEAIAMTAPVRTVRGGGEAASMTAPVRTVRGGGEAASMTAPVRTDREGSAVTMTFYLPSEYDPETAPSPTDPKVRLVVEPPRTVAARRFSWYATDDRVERERRALLDVLAERDVEPLGSPVLLQYDDPWTPPFLRRNEVEVLVEPPGESSGG